MLFYIHLQNTRLSFPLCCRNVTHCDNYVCEYLRLVTLKNNVNVAIFNQLLHATKNG